MAAIVTIDALKIILDSFKNIMACEENIINDNYNEKIGGKEISITINNTFNNSKTTYNEIDTFILTDIPEDSYILRGFATENGGAVVYNIGDRITEDTELWTVYQTQVSYLYNSENDPNYNPSDMSSPYWNGVKVLHFDNVFEAICPTGNTAQTITFTVETDAELKEGDNISYWLNGYCTEWHDQDNNVVPGAETAYVTKIEDGVYEISWSLYWNYYNEIFTPGESYPIAGFGDALYSNNYFETFSSICNTSNLGTYFKVRDEVKIEDR
jgi:hypothetical protein